MPLPGDVDPSALVLASRRPGERFFCMEQPERDGWALATLGAAAVVEASGTDRFGEAARRCREISSQLRREGDETIGGPVFVGGFAFAPDGGRSHEWDQFAPAQMVLPEVVIVRHRGEAAITFIGPERELSRAGIGMLDPDPVRRPRISSGAPPEHYVEAVRGAVERIRAGEMEKIVLAREVRVHAPAAVDPGPVFDALRGAFPACFSYLVGAGDTAFLGASPELLVRRDGARAQTVALAGTARRSADPAVDDLLGEQLAASPKIREEHEIVARRIERTLEPKSVWVAAAEEPVLVKVLNVQHLATPIRAQLAEPISALELAGRLHPTPAVGGEPREVAVRMIPALEGLDRGWYAGPVGWTDVEEDGEFCVALRCALMRKEVAHLYAGCGIVRDSVPEDELAETEAKLEALLPLLS